MHFDFTVTLGQLLVAATLAGGFFKFYTPLAERVWEHDMMWEKFAEDNNIARTERPRPRARSASAGGHQ